MGHGKTLGKENGCLGGFARQAGILAGNAGNLWLLVMLTTVASPYLAAK